jgi:hypothetical protein
VLRTRVTVLLSLLAISAGLAACGGGGASKASSTATSSTLPAAVAAWVSCLTSHGYTPPAQLLQRLASPPTTDANGNPGGAFGGGGTGGGGGFGGGGGDTGGPSSTIPAAQRAARQAALSACASQAPAGFQFVGGGGANPGALLSRLRNYADCLANKGYPVLKTAVQAYTATSTTPSTTTPAGQPPGGGGGGRLRQLIMSVNQSDPAFVAANAICGPLAPPVGRRGGGSTTTSTILAGG